MPTNANSLAVWTETNQTLTDDLNSVLELLAREPFSADPASPHVRAQKERERLVNAMQRHAVLGMKLIDDEIAAGPLVGEINDLSKEAKREAELIKNAAKTIDGITKAVDLVAGVVDKFNALPFL